MRTASVVLFAHSEFDFKLRKESILNKLKIKQEIIFCDSRVFSRMDFLQKNLNQWFIFLDSDCEIALETLVYLNQLPLLENQIVAGLYVNPTNATYIQKVHNFIANTWLDSSYLNEVQNPNLLGGAFLIYSNSNLLKNASSVRMLFWGAEDKGLAVELAGLGYQIKIDHKFLIAHFTSQSLVHFFRRAWLQGYNDQISPMTNTTKTVAKIKYWFSALGLKETWLFPAVLVHFLVLQMGKLFQKIHRLNNPKKLK